jgi:hypothetical protein
MAYNREVWTIQNDFHVAWQKIRASLTQMHPSTSIQPGNAPDIFRPDSASGDPKFNIGPIIFNVPERAKDNGAKLYVVVEGWITFGPPLAVGEKRTTLQFGTQVGYFRQKNSQLIHVYGIHYDMDEVLPGHPVFHAQMSTQAKLVPIVERFTRLKFDPNNDSLRGLLRNVRTPTAQMDAFSVITQIGADHLVSESSGAEVIEAFKKLRAACDFFLGAGANISYLNSLPATHCYRSTH